MLKIIDVDHVEDFKLALAFNDGFEGIVDLQAMFSQEPFSRFAGNFLSFSLADGTLRWADNPISPDYLRDIAESCPTDTVYVDPNDPLDVITAAFRESLEEDDPSILQAVLRGYAEKIGMAKVVNDAGIRSRTSVYKSLSKTGSPKWETIVKLAHSIIKLKDDSPPATV